MTWLERTDGYFFPQENLSEAIQSKLQVLILEDAAQISDGGTLIPFEKSFALSEEDAELLNLPPNNPYQISIRTEGYIGAKNFRYVAEFLNSEGHRFKPQINGAIVHIGKNIFRLNAAQFALIKLTELGNEEPLLIVKKIQRQATESQAQVDKYIADKKIIAPDKLGIDFQDSGDAVKVLPILLENRDGKSEPIDCADFQTAFDKRRKILSSYKGKDGSQYVFSETLQDGLAQIKSVGTLSKEDAARYKLQPKELFTGEAFDFDYSDRVIGVEEISVGAYQISGGVKINWSEEKFQAAPAPQKNSTEHPKTFVLKIKQNIERNIYEKASATRQENFLAEVLCPDVKLFPHQIQGVWKISELWQKGWHGILIADDMGLGKTLQTLTFIGGLKKFCNVIQPTLIVAPTALLVTWQIEYKKFLRGNIFDKVISLHGEDLKKFFTNDRTPNGRKKIIVEKFAAERFGIDDLRNFERLSIFVRGNFLEHYSCRRIAENKKSDCRHNEGTQGDEIRLRNLFERHARRKFLAGFVEHNGFCSARAPRRLKDFQSKVS